MRRFEVDVLVRFGHCDPAGIVYYPRYFEMINDVVEDWLANGIGVGLPILLYERKLLVPTVAFNVEFPQPSHFGDILNFSLSVTRLGRSACTLAIRAECRGETRIAVRQVLVFVSAENRSSTPVPDDLRNRIGAFVAPSET